MLRSETLFGKRETPASTLPVNSSTVNLSGSANMAKPTVTPGPNLTSSLSSSFSSTGTPLVSALTSQPAPSGGNFSDNGFSSPIASTNETGSKLIVGPNIKLKGVEITDCDTVVVEGRVEATIDSRVIQIAECGAFKGAAEIDIAEIRGEFDGELVVRQRLVIYATGKVSGKVRYGKLVVEEGGQLSGDIQVGTAGSPAARNLAVAKSAN
jgi:cytoskeletal protein CcmA (bactofilin family)